MNKQYREMTVLATEAGDNFHIFADCAALETGRRNSVKAGRDLSGEFNLTAEEAIEDGLFGCRLCHRKAGIALPIEADRKALRASRKAARALAASNAAKEATREANADVKTAEKDGGLDNVNKANAAQDLALALQRRAALLIALAALYRSTESDKARWTASRRVMMAA